MHLVDDAAWNLDASRADEVAHDGRVDGRFFPRAAQHLLARYEVTVTCVSRMRQTSMWIPGGWVYIVFFRSEPVSRGKFKKEKH